MSRGFRLAFAWLFATQALAESHASPIMSVEFIAMHSPTPQCHAGTIVDTPTGLVAAWFGGKRERDPSVGIWVSRQLAGHWTGPREVAHGARPDGSRLPTWNPVLFRSASGRLMLFYKVGPDPQHWWGMEMTSRDDGASWSAPRRLPPGVLGPIKNKPIQLPDGAILSPSSTELGGWKIHVERSTDDGETWVAGGDVSSNGIDAIQPSLIQKRRGVIEAMGRTRQGKLFWSRSADAGLHWSPLRLLDVDNPNSGIDSVALADGRYLLVYNPTRAGPQWWDGRGTLAVAISNDGWHWKRVLTLEDTPGQEYSYPAVIQSRDGLIHVVYTWQRMRMRHVVIDPASLDGGAPRCSGMTIRKRYRGWLRVGPVRGCSLAPFRSEVSIPWYFDFSSLRIASTARLHSEAFEIGPAFRMSGTTWRLSDALKNECSRTRRDQDDEAANDAYVLQEPREHDGSLRTFTAPEIIENHRGR